jgi:hypothetical protein
MKIIDAIWDEKVTGLKTCEIVFEETDTFQSYLEADIENNFKFSVTKIPIGNIELVHNLEDIGYRYLENQLDISFNVDQIEYINPIWQRLFYGFSYKLIREKEEIDNVKLQVSEGMFEADRYSRDPFWKSDISSRRYVNWIDDLFKKEQVKFYVMIKNEKEVGFFTIKAESQTTISCPIAGIYNQYKFSGYIFVLAWYLLILSRETGAKRWISSISTNNRNILSSFSKIFTFNVNDIFIVLRKIIPV